jgi:Fe-S-cluster containining protein
VQHGLQGRADAAAERAVPLEPQQESRVAEAGVACAIAAMSVDEVLPFPCTSCGECCRRVGRAPALAHLDRGDGACRHLDERTLLCGIYADRPRECRVDAGFDALGLYFASRDAYLTATAAVCNMWQAERGLPRVYRVRVR